MASDPVRPYPGYLDRVAREVSQRARNAPPVTSEHRGAPATLHAAVGEHVEELGPALIQLSHDLHAHPELGYEEHYAVRAVARLLDQHAIEAEIGCYGLDTALRARVGTGRPRVALLAEYDALPDIGHACGHNVICAMSVGAFLALACLIEDLDGSIELIGTPAEEGGGGKEYIARAGGFDDVDAALMLHPMGVDVAEHPWLGVRQVEVRYRGLPAHAAMMPFHGRNALDAVVTAYNGISQLRQHILPGDRVHGIITDGGRAANIVPERAAARFYLRSQDPEALVELSDRVRAVLEAAAQATATQVEISWDPFPPYLPVRTNGPLAARYAVNVAERGRRVLPSGILPPQLAASSDLGNVSVRIPAIQPLIAVAPPAVTIHTAEFADWAVSERADAATLDGAIGLARTAADYLSDESLRRASLQEFEAAGGVLEVTSLLS